MTRCTLKSCVTILELFLNHFRGDAQAKMGKTKDTKGSFHKKLTELKKKIKQTSNDANACDDGWYMQFLIK